MDAPKKNVRYVPDDIGKVLRSGGPCVVRAQREKKNQVLPRGTLVHVLLWELTLHGGLVELVQVCDGCGSENIVEIRSQGDLVCEDCGLVFR